VSKVIGHKWWRPVGINRVVDHGGNIPARHRRLFEKLASVDGRCIEEDDHPHAALCHWRIITNLSPIDLELLILQDGFQKSGSFPIEDGDTDYNDHDYGSEGLCYSDPDIDDCHAVWWIAQIGSTVFLHDC